MIQQTILSDIEAEISHHLGKNIPSSAFSPQEPETGREDTEAPKKYHEIVPRRNKGKYRKALKYSGYSLISITMLLAGLIFVPSAFPELSAYMADNLRTVLGSGIVAGLEELSFSVQDNLNRLRYNAGDNQQIKVELPKQSAAAYKSTSLDRISDSLVKNGWEVLSSYSSQNIIFTRKINPDETRPYAQVVLSLVRLDKVNLNFAHEGSIPAEKQNENLVAAFNGGFKPVHGRYGMMDNYDVILPPRENIATLLIFNDNSIDITSWTFQNIIPPNLKSFRQNCPLIVQNGEISDILINRSPALWGYTVDNSQVTWRSGAGITADKKFLIYGLGKSLTVKTLAKALKESGVHNAMQLDINWQWTKFIVYTQKPPLTAQKIVNGINVRNNEYLTGNNGVHSRDFFYLTYKKDS